MSAERGERGGLGARRATRSDHQRLAPPRREALLDAIGTAPRGLGDAFEMPSETMLVEARPAGDPPPMI